MKYIYISESNLNYKTKTDKGSVPEIYFYKAITTVLNQSETQCLQMT